MVPVARGIATVSIEVIECYCCTVIAKGNSIDCRIVAAIPRIAAAIPRIAAAIPRIATAIPRIAITTSIDWEVTDVKISEDGFIREATKTFSLQCD